jgi:acyl-CoA hydrolase
MDLKTVCPDKVVDAETAIAKIKNGSRVFIGTGCGEPQHLIRTMVEDLSMQDIMVYQMLVLDLFRLCGRSPVFEAVLP